MVNRVWPAAAWRHADIMQAAQLRDWVCDRVCVVAEATVIAWMLGVWPGVFRRLSALPIGGQVPTSGARIFVIAQLAQYHEGLRLDVSLGLRRLKSQRENVGGLALSVEGGSPRTPYFRRPQDQIWTQRRGHLFLA